MCESERKLSARLRSAINAGDYKAVQRLVKGGVDINARYWYGSTLLHEAVSMSSVDLVLMLIRAGADVNSTNQDGRTALHLACRGGHLDIVKALIAAGTNLNTRTLDGKTCLHVAVWRGHKEVIELLVEAGANIDIIDSEGCTPLYWAARSNYLPILKILVSKGAKLNYRVKNKWTPLHIALHLGHMAVVRYLLLHGAETNIIVDNKSVVSLLMDNQHLSSQIRQDTLDMFVQAGYNLHRDTWTSCISNRSSSSRLTVRPSTSSSTSADQQGPKKTIEGTSTAVPASAAEVMGKWLEKRKEVLPTLTCLCRTRIRKRLSYCNKGRSISSLVPKLCLPTILENFVSFKADKFLDPDTQVQQIGK